ncbi:MAG: LysR family transcriptional regulator [Salinisphaeraceae bacterium]|nr:LysR family transcriptional regulator [Salinisphaeraceae bacterium]
MDTQWLEAFIAVAENNSFSQAAEVLHLTQPAVSKRIAALEERHATQLFDRIGRNVQLTEAGRALLPHARRVMQEIEDSRRALSQLGEGISGRLSIGTSHHIGLHHLPPILRHYAQLYPAVDLDIDFMDSEQATHAVELGRLELAIVTLPPTVPQRLATDLIWPDPMAVVASPNHPLAKLKTLSVDNLAAHPALLPDAQTYTHSIVRKAMAEHGLSPRVRLATNYLETLKVLVSVGLGWSALPLTMTDEHVIALPVPGIKLGRELGVVRHAKRSLSRAAEELLQLLLAEAPG